MRQDLLIKKFRDELFENEELKEIFEEKVFQMYKDAYTYNPGFTFEMIASYDEEENEFTLKVFEFYGGGYVRISENEIHLFSLESSYYSTPITDGSYLEEEKIQELTKEYEEKIEEVKKELKELEENFDEEIDSIHDIEYLEDKILDLRFELEDAINDIEYTEEEIEELFKYYWDFGYGLDEVMDKMNENLDWELKVFEVNENCYIED